MTTSYRISLRDVRLATDGTDDVAWFDVTREDDDQTWVVSALLSPLFRLINMKATLSPDGRRQMVAGLGARSIVDHLQRGEEPPSEPMLFSLHYPGAPGDPDPLSSYEQVDVEVSGWSSE